MGIRLLSNSLNHPRFRGQVEDGGFDDEGESVTIFGTRYWQLQTARLAFVIVFEVSRCGFPNVVMCVCGGGGGGGEKINGAFRDLL